MILKIKARQTTLTTQTRKPHIHRVADLLRWCLAIDVVPCHQENDRLDVRSLREGARLTKSSFINCLHDTLILHKQTNTKAQDHTEDNAYPTQAKKVLRRKSTQKITQADTLSRASSTHHWKAPPANDAPQ